MAKASTREAPRTAENQTVETDVPARLDRLPWSRWHTRIIVALGTSWLLDGLEVTLVGSLSGVLESKNGLSLTDPQVTSAATFYLAGAVMGAILFGYLTDRLGRKKLFLVTLATYSLATIASAFSWNFLSFAIFRFFTGCGIGGEYSAINSAVDELIPGKVRGTVDLVVNGTFWVGATMGSLAAMFLLHGHGLSAATSWRYAFGVGGSLGAAVLVLRLYVPESPRWLMLRGYRGTGKQGCQGDRRQGIERQSWQLARAGGKEAQNHRPRSYASQRDFSQYDGRQPSEIFSCFDAHGGSGLLLQCRLFHLCAGGEEVLSRKQRRSAAIPVAFCSW